MRANLAFWSKASGEPEPPSYDYVFMDACSSVGIVAEIPNYHRDNFCWEKAPTFVEYGSGGFGFLYFRVSSGPAPYTDLLGLIRSSYETGPEKINLISQEITSQVDTGGGNWHTYITLVVENVEVGTWAGSEAWYAVYPPNYSGEIDTWTPDPGPPKGREIFYVNGDSYIP